MSCASFRTPKAVCGWCARWPSRRTRTGSKRPAISTWIIGRGRRKRLYGPWPPDGGRARQRYATRGSAPLRARHQPEPFAELDAHNSDLTAAERGELLRLLRDTIAADRYPLLPQVRTLKSKLGPKPARFSARFESSR